MHPRVRAVFPLLFLATTLIGYSALSREASKPAIGVEPVLRSGKTILGQPFSYPMGTQAQVTAVVLTMPPGSETGLHKHDIPLFGYVLEGELTVTYEGHGKRVYKAGDALIEAIGTPHNGRNESESPVRILALFMGAQNIPNTVPIR